MFPTPFFLLYKRLYSDPCNILAKGAITFFPGARVKCSGPSRRMFKDPNFDLLKVYIDIYIDLLLGFI